MSKDLFVPTGEQSIELQEKLITENPSKEFNITLSNAAALIDEIDKMFLLLKSQR